MMGTHKTLQVPAHEPCPRLGLQGWNVLCRHHLAYPGFLQFHLILGGELGWLPSASASLTPRGFSKSCCPRPPVGESGEEQHSNLPDQREDQNARRLPLQEPGVHAEITPGPLAQEVLKERQAPSVRSPAQTSSHLSLTTTTMAQPPPH